MRTLNLLLASLPLLMAVPLPTQASENADSPMTTATANRHDFATVMRGARLFQDNCTSCHGAGAEGGIVPNFNVPAPALNGSAHAWHHPLHDLVGTIEYGTVARGGHMPAWGDKLSEQEILAIISWFQSRWPDEIYARWQERNHAARQ